MIRTCTGAKTDVDSSAGDPIRKRPLFPHFRLVILAFFFLVIQTGVLPFSAVDELSPFLSGGAPWSLINPADGGGACVQPGASIESSRGAKSSGSAKPDSSSMAEIRYIQADSGCILRGGASQFNLRMVSKKGGPGRLPVRNLNAAQLQVNLAAAALTVSTAYRASIQEMPFHFQTILKRVRPVRAGPVRRFL